MTVSLQTDASREEKVVRLGLLLPITGWTEGRTILGAATLAINEINGHPNGLMQGRRLEFVYEDDGCSPMLGTTALSRLLEAKATKPIHAVIGASCNAACLPSGFLAAGSNLPQVSYGCSSGTTRLPLECLYRPP
jgi:ABC-type branched-subunit amino acid transport system substrate-binding protein